jgi:hypothetical protein
MVFIIAIFLILFVFILFCVIFTCNNNRDLLPKPNSWEPTAWARGNDLYEIDVVGESHYQNALSKICGGKKYYSAEVYKEAILVYENNNKYDKNAIIVFIDGQKVGYLNKDNAKQTRAIFNELKIYNPILACKAKITGGWDRGGGDTGYFGLKLDIANPSEEVETQNEIYIDIVGESKFQQPLKIICKDHVFGYLHKEAILYLEDENIDDRNAVAVLIDGYPVGYLNSSHAKKFRKTLRKLKIENNVKLNARIFEGATGYVVQLNILDYLNG